jgi:hypothetical protein
VDPFLGLHDRGAFSRALLAEVVGPGDEPLMRVVLKLQSDEYPIVAAGEPSQWNNLAVERAWRREVELLERCRGTSAGLPAPVEVLPREQGDAAALPPTFFCKRRRAFFVAPCPRCGGPLADVRDGRLLEERGLPRFDLSLARFLGCAACLARGERILYTLIAEASTIARDVLDQAALFAAYGELARRKAADPAAAVLPCQGCQHVPTCYPDAPGARGDAVRFLTPFTFYESRAIALEVLHLRYDEFSALLGGAPFAEIVAAVTEPGRTAALRGLEDHFTHGPQYLFAQDMAGKLGLEVLRLKLMLFAELCRAVGALGRLGAEPHLGITPARAMIRVLDQQAALPARWNFRLVLQGLGNARPRALGPSSDGLPARPYASPRLIDPIYSAPPLRALPVSDQPGILTLRRLASATDGRVALVADLACDGAELADLGDKDVLELSIVQGRPPLSLTFLATPTGMVGPALTLESVPLALDAATRGQLEQLLGQSLARARFSVYPCVDVPCDIYSLGMMLFTALLANGEQSPAGVARAVGDLASRVTLWARAHPRAGGEEVTAHAASLLDLGDGSAFSKAHLFARPDPGRRAPAAIPDGLWVEALTVALRAVTTIPGFSLCRGWSDFDPAHREVKAEFLLGLVESLIREVDALLFGLPGRRREIRDAIAQAARQIATKSPLS